MQLVSCREDIINRGRSATHTPIGGDQRVKAAVIHHRTLFVMCALVLVLKPQPSGPLWSPIECIQACG